MLQDNLKYNENVKPNTLFLKELKENLPAFFTADQVDEDGNLIEEGKFDLEKFQRALQENNIDELTSGYQLEFIGKDYAKKQAGEYTTTVIVPNNDHNHLEENKNSKHLFFTGDNLEVLRHLQNNYNNSIDMIYIDPPYNTGSDGFVYPDKFEYSDQVLKDIFGMNEAELQRLKSIQGKATHSAWLTFMYPRLWLAKRLLSEKGVIFMSIDDNEMMNLKFECDEIFGENNYIACLSVENNPKGRKNSSFVSVSNEYVLVYAKDKSKSSFVENIPKKASDMAKDENGNYVHNSGKRVVVGENSFNHKVTDFDSKKHYSVYYHKVNDALELIKEKSVDEQNEALINEGYSRYISFYKGEFVENTYTEEKLRELFAKKALDFTEKKLFEKNYSSKIRIKSMLKNEEYDAIINNEVKRYKFDIKTTSAGTYQKALFAKNDLLFDAPKSTDLIKGFMTLFEQKDITVLDFFAGSATTADAVMQLNAEDGGTRQFIMIQLPEKTYALDHQGTKIANKSSKSAFHAGYLSIDEISRDRIQKASRKIQEETGLALPKQFDGGFKHYTVVAPEQPTLDDLEAFDMETGLFKDASGQFRQLSENGFDDMIQPFSAEGLQVEGNASGEDTILTTWLVADGYPLDVEVERIELHGYQASYVDHSRIYVMHTQWNATQTRELLNLIGTNQLAVQTIVVYGYSFDLESIRELELGLKQLNRKVHLVKRY
ncbi:DNA methyltransferase [Sporosarcina sp. FSL K6-1522]|uniref:site-specific DNA-methyltransferase n=1 Tax=Sporosarcina sp. FSL K6-1522 TaxID=2921554 RepID=UPI00315A8286